MLREARTVGRCRAGAGAQFERSRRCAADGRYGAVKGRVLDVNSLRGVVVCHGDGGYVLGYAGLHTKCLSERAGAEVLVCAWWLDALNGPVARRRAVARLAASSWAEWCLRHVKCNEVGRACLQMQSPEDRLLPGQGTWAASCSQNAGCDSLHTITINRVAQDCASTDTALRGYRRVRE